MFSLFEDFSFSQTETIYFSASDYMHTKKDSKVLKPIFIRNLPLDADINMQQIMYHIFETIIFYRKVGMLEMTRTFEEHRNLYLKKTTTKNPNNSWHF